MSASDRRTYLVRHPDPYPDRPVERAHHGRGVGRWVPEEKHRILADFIEATWGARKKWPHRVYLDLFSGPGRIQVEGEEDTRDGGSLIAWRQSSRMPAGQFTQVIVGDLDPDRSAACGERLRAAGANTTVLSGPAVETARQAVQLVPQRSSLCLAYIDPYSLEHLSFEIIQTLATLPRIDFAVHFSTMDLTRNVEAEFERGRFHEAIPGWADAIDPTMVSKRKLREDVFDYWCGLVKQLGFTFSRRQPLIKNDANKPLYRLVFFSRSPLPNDIWDDVAQGDTKDLFG